MSSKNKQTNKKQNERKLVISQKKCFKSASKKGSCTISYHWLLSITLENISSSCTISYHWLLSIPLENIRKRGYRKRPVALNKLNFTRFHMFTCSGLFVARFQYITRLSVLFKQRHKLTSLLRSCPKISNPHC